MSYRGYVITVNKWTEKDLELLRKLFRSSTYSIIGFEKAPTTGTPHLQAYGYWHNKKSWNVVYKHVPHGNIIIANGTPTENQVYCSKDGVFEETGDCPRQGARTDLQLFKDDIESGMSEIELLERHTEYMAKYDRFYQRVRNINLKKKSHSMEAPEIIVLVGEPGTGKTRHVYDNNNIDDIYKLEVGDGSHNSVFWDGYSGENVILIDDFHNNLKLDYMLRLLDRYPMKLNIKGGYTYRASSKIYITSNIEPKYWYPNCPEVHKRALLRRITNIMNLQCQHDETTQHNTSIQPTY